MIRKGQVRWLTKGDLVGQVAFVAGLFDLALQPDSARRPATALCTLIAFANHTLFFTVRWSCSITLFRYLHWRKATRLGSRRRP